ncbi:hypothetical protein H0E87_031681, partial [Populus deltoides]
GFGSQSYMYKINGTANINAIRAASEKGILVHVKLLQPIVRIFSENGSFYDESSHIFGVTNKLGILMVVDVMVLKILFYISSGLWPITCCKDIAFRG